MSSLVPLLEAELGDQSEEFLSLVGAAVDPLEVAAALETCGLSNSVVRGKFGFSDVFHMARELYGHVEPRVATVEGRPGPRPGMPADIARGLVYAAPALMFAGFTAAIARSLAWWSLPMALICGWAFSQFLAFAGYSRRSRGESLGPVVLWTFSASSLSCVAVALLGEWVLGGAWSGIGFALLQCGVMIAAAVLVVYEELALLVAALIPGTVGAVIGLGSLTPDSFRVAMGLTGLTVAILLLFALRHLRSGGAVTTPVESADLRQGSRYFVHGCFSGVAVAAFVILEERGTSSGWAAIASLPLILSLGTMEWQLHSFKAAAFSATRRAHSVRAFRRMASFALLRSIGAYLLVQAALTSGILVASSAGSLGVSPVLLAAGSALSLAFFLSLVAIACGDIRGVLFGWPVAVFPYASWLLLSRFGEVSTSPAFQRLAFVTSGVVAAAAMLLIARKSAINPFHHV